MSLCKYEMSNKKIINKRRKNAIQRNCWNPWDCSHTHTQVFLYKCVNLPCLQYKRGTNNTYAEDSRVGFVCVAQNNIKEIIGYIFETRKLEKCF